MSVADEYRCLKYVTIHVNSGVARKSWFRTDSLCVSPVIPPTTFNPRISCSSVWSINKLVNRVPFFSTQRSPSFWAFHTSLDYESAAHSSVLIVVTSVEHSCKEVFDLRVDGCQILFPVALSAYPDHVQQPLNLMWVRHKEGTYFASIITCYGRLQRTDYTFRVLFAYVTENANICSVMIVQTFS